MMEYDERILVEGPRKKSIFRFRPAAWILIPLAAILFQVYVPRFIETLSYLELPLLVTIYFSLMRRQPVAGALIGAAIGLLQDSLSHHEVGLYGISKTLVGYCAASISQRFDVENPALRLVATFAFFIVHQGLFWMLAVGLLGRQMPFQLPQTVIYAFLNALVALPLYVILDRLKAESR